MLVLLGIDSWSIIFSNTFTLIYGNGKSIDSCTLIFTQSPYQVHLFRRGCRVPPKRKLVKNESSPSSGQKTRRVLGKEGSEVIFVPVFPTNYLGDSDVRAYLGSSRRDHQIQSWSRLSHNTPQGLEQLPETTCERHRQYLTEAKRRARDQLQQRTGHRKCQPPRPPEPLYVNRRATSALQSKLFEKYGEHLKQTRSLIWCDQRQPLWVQKLSHQYDPT